ncbi:tetratricopeptide repeat protein [Kribbella sp. NBC_00382]|uniref:tetratricopeptide repeat protein n=1 Tax=Kribbella sp. NBC_00382 TaxID=2975967 RepID=UPI002E1C3B36
MGTRLGGLLRTHRAAAGLSREALAERAALSVEAIRALENGRRRYPRPSTIEQLAGALGLPAGEQDLLVQAAQRPASQIVPRQLPPDLADFVGREQALDELVGALTAAPAAAGGAVLVAIAGMGGIGKTSLAVRAAQQTADAFPDGQLYVDLRGHGGDPVPPLEALGRLLWTLGVRDVPDELAAASARYRSMLAGRRVLLMLDNAASASQVGPLLPGTAETVTLVTSRRRLSGLDGARHLPLDLLSEAEGVRLLGSVAEHRTEQEPTAAAEVVRLCGRLPLALRIAGTYLADRPELSLAQLAAALTDEQSKLGVLSSTGLGVRSSLGVSIEALAASTRKVDQTAARALPLISLLPGDDFSLRVAAAALGLPAIEVETALEHLVDVNLLETPALRRYRIHDLIRAVGHDLALSMTSEEDRAALRLRVLDQYVAMLWRSDELDPQSPVRDKWHDPAWVAGAMDLPDLESALEEFEADRNSLVLTAQAAATGSAAERERVIRIAVGASLACRHHRRWLEWKQLNEFAVGVVDERSDPQGAFMIHFDLGLAQAELGDFAGGADHLATARRLAAELGEAEYEAKSLMNLAHMLEQADRLDEGRVAAQDSMEQAIRLGHESLEAYSRLILGQIAGKEGEFETQRAAFESTIGVIRRTDRPVRVAAMQLTIAEAYRTTGRYDEAVDALQQAEVIHRALGSDGGVAEVLDHLGAVWFELGRYEDALESQQDALKLALDVEAQDREANVRLRMGQTLAALGRVDEARVEWQAALRFYESQGSPQSAHARQLLARQ